MDARNQCARPHLHGRYLRGLTVLPSSERVGEPELDDSRIHDARRLVEVRTRQRRHIENRIQIQDVEHVRSDGKLLSLVQVERLLEPHVELMADRQATLADRLHVHRDARDGPAAREADSRWIGELWQNYLATVAANRQITPEQVFPGAQAMLDGLTKVGGDTAKYAGRAAVKAYRAS